MRTCAQLAGSRVLGDELRDTHFNKMMEAVEGVKEGNCFLCLYDLEYLLSVEYFLVQFRNLLVTVLFEKKEKNCVFISKLR